MTRLKADLLLLLTALIWGTTFVAQKYANDSIGPVSFVGARFFISALALAPLMIFESRKQQQKINAKEWRLAAAIGFLLFAGSALQQIGLLTTTATNAGFLTALYIVLVPFVVWCLTGNPPRILVLVACVISITGAWLLSSNGGYQPLARGDIQVILSDFAWATQIALVPVFLNRTHRPYFLCFVQYGVCALLGLGLGSVMEPSTMQSIVQAAPSILYAGLLSGGIAYTLQIVAQKYVPAAEAALIVSLESVFAAIAGAWMLRERLTPIATIGCMLIFLGALCVELGPTLLRNIWPQCKRRQNG